MSVMKRAIGNIIMLIFYHVTGLAEHSPIMAVVINIVLQTVSTSGHM